MIMNRTRLKLALLFGLIASAGHASQDSTAPLPCDRISLARPGVGADYRGEFRNSDYRLSLTVPTGSVGWGAGVDAPFHGFTIFLTKSDDKTRTSCIDFSIEPEPLDAPELGPGNVTHKGDTLKVAGYPAFREARSGVIDGVMFKNEVIGLSITRQGRTSNIVFTLVTPVRDLRRTERIFEQFVSSLKLW